jgi:hypothetical protein
MAGGLDQRRELGADQEQLAMLDQGVTVGDVGAAGADRLQLPALEGQAGLVPLLQVVFVPGAFVQGNGLGDRRALARLVACLCLILADFLLAHSSYCP